MTSAFVVLLVSYFSFVQFQLNLLCFDIRHLSIYPSCELDSIEAHDNPITQYTALMSNNVTSLSTVSRLPEQRLNLSLKDIAQAARAMLQANVAVGDSLAMQAANETGAISSSDWVDFISFCHVEVCQFISILLYCTCLLHNKYYYHK